ncbi:MAG: endonuclease III domain-containing protein [Candidatus Micrarchaeia archaeon]
MAQVRFIYKILLNYFGFQNWWPGDSDFEIAIGAILTQQASWGNVEKAIQNLKKGNLIDIEKICNLNISDLEKYIRPSGYYHQKAAYLKYFSNYVIKNYGSLDNFFKLEKKQLRKELLSLKGIGPETADSIILYAANKKTFVIDAYTRRIMERVNGIRQDMPYDKMQKYFEKQIPDDLEIYKDLHAQLVKLGKEFCFKNSPACIECPLSNVCKYKKIKNK